MILDTVAHIRGSLFRWRNRITRPQDQIGAGLRLYCRLRISGKGAVSIGERCIIANLIGDTRQHVTVTAHLATSRVSIGSRAYLVGARIASKFSISVGNDCLIEDSGVVDTNYHSLDRSRDTPGDETPERCAIQIGDNVRVGARSYILQGVKVGQGVTVLPGSIVTRDIPPNITVCGNPARPVQF